MRSSTLTLCTIALLVPLGSKGALLLQSSIWDSPPIYYSSQTPAGPVAQFAEKLANGEADLEFTSEHGYLQSLLENLNVPASSQVLVFSKTSLQVDRIGPSRPRALYFNDDVYVGWIPTAPLMELASVDPDLGTVFYTLSQEESAAPRFERRLNECLGCHGGAATDGVPGLMMRSVYSDNAGNPLLRAGTFLTTDGSPWYERWGGWYVTGTYGDKVHMGNNMVPHHAFEIGRNLTDHIARLDIDAGANLPSVTDRFDHQYYISPHSDVVALLVLAHQTNLHNLITRVNYEAQIALLRQGESGAESLPTSVSRSLRGATERLVYAMLFTGEPPFAGPVRGTSDFAQEFVLAGPRDRMGRSLRDLDLDRRLFRYPLSYLIYSEGFDRLPDLAKDLIYGRLREILTGEDTTGTYDHLSESDRTAILEILGDTISDWSTGSEPLSGHLLY